MEYPERVRWVFQVMLEGLLRGRSLRDIAEDVVIGLGNIIAGDLKKKDAP